MNIKPDCEIQEPSRRAALSGISLLLSTPAFALPPFALIMLPIIGQSVANLLESRRNEELQLKLASAQLAFQWATIQLQVGEVEAAHVSYRGALATLGVLSRNADGYGTMMAVDRGRVYIERNGMGGYLTPDEVRLFNGLPDEGRPLPVPVEPDTYRSRIDRETSRIAADRASTQQGLTSEAFEVTQSLAGMRRFSSGRSPSFKGDSTLLLTANRSPTQIAGKVGRQMNTYSI
ncbi:hypothetical protein [Inhella sp.]|uniref:hypothetical protein n=1 Tax=Inhella sp. TaxID=1921806 RepID=UPI0035B23BD4